MDDYYRISNPENMELRLKKHMSKIQEVDLVLVFSVGKINSILASSTGAKVEVCIIKS